MDNRVIDITSEGKNDFDLAMRLAFGDRKNAIAYQIKDNTLIFYWTEYDTATALPYKMAVGDAINFAWGWLESSSPSGNEPDIDGDIEKGFRVYNEAWGHVFNAWQAIIGIKPVWAMYGK